MDNFVDWIRLISPITPHCARTIYKFLEPNDLYYYTGDMIYGNDIKLINNINVIHNGTKKKLILDNLSVHRVTNCIFKNCIFNHILVNKFNNCIFIDCVFTSC